MDKDRVNLVLAIIVGFIVGGLICGFLGRLIFPKIKTVQEIITVYNSSKEKAKIDSLETIIDGKEMRIAELLDSAKHIKNVVVIKEVEKVKELPISENVSLLRENLIKHGELTEKNDTLPSTIVLDSPDTLALLSENNVKDVNIIASKYEGEVKINEKLTEALVEEEGIVSQKDSIINLQSSIMINQELGYSAEIKGLEKSLKKEKVEKTVWTAILGSVAAILGIVAISK